MGAGWLAGRGRLILYSLALPREDWVICFVGLGAGGWGLGGLLSERPQAGSAAVPFPSSQRSPHHTYHTISQACLLRVGSLSCLLLSAQHP